MRTFFAPIDRVQDKLNKESRLMNMKNKLILFTLVMALILSMVYVPNTGKASAASEPLYDYLILGNAVYESSAKSTLASELALAQKSKNPKRHETFSENTEKRMVRSWFKFDHTFHKQSGFQANSYYNPTRNEIVIAFAGTNDDYDWLGPKRLPTTKTIGTILTTRSHPQKVEALKYVARIAQTIGKTTYPKPNTKPAPKIKSDAKIVMTGHSLGGYLVQVAGVYMIDHKSLSNKFKTGYTFNAMGITKKDMSTAKQWNDRKKSKYNKFAHLWITNEIVHSYNVSSARDMAGSTAGLRPIKIGQSLSSTKLQYHNHSYKALYGYVNWE